MKTTMNIAIVAVMAALSAPAQAEETKSPILGAWQMTSLEGADASGNYTAVPYSGQVIFAESGTLSVQASNPDLEAEDTPYTLNGYEAYYGPVIIDDEAGTFAITVTSAVTRDLEGQELVRNFEVTGDQLVITPVDVSEGWRVTYDRQ